MEAAGSPAPQPGASSASLIPNRQCVHGPLACTKGSFLRGVTRPLFADGELRKARERLGRAGTESQKPRSCRQVSVSQTCRKEIAEGPAGSNEGMRLIRQNRFSFQLSFQQTHDFYQGRGTRTPSKVSTVSSLCLCSGLPFPHWRAA